MATKCEQFAKGVFPDVSAETWSVLKINFQLKQVREHLAKGLVNKGALRAEKRNFLLFDMATHPVAGVLCMADLISMNPSMSATIWWPPSKICNNFE
ncbi:Vacuolar protein sorting-associated protein 74 [Mycena venus]|uniref:Vacuolar protein sorting-associated protein 74 n=1 Tax=Mycena venus TaxID=2733690 RepID=A0A8H6U3F7_9AGAR|nr:Vacuolar protein sorting-associated protein 74 [Mycena venus]